MTGPVVVLGHDELDLEDVRWAARVALHRRRALRLVAVLAPAERSFLGARPAPGSREVARSVLDRRADEIAFEVGGLDVEAEMRIQRWDRAVADEARTASLVVLPHHQPGELPDPAGCAVVRSGVPAARSRGRMRWSVGAATSSGGASDGGRAAAPDPPGSGAASCRPPGPGITRW
ncbi:hypothetical protein [Pseudonocardia spirodelae]|uniref:UspA domain-containing protein n=1 Tax=Pseudonocardia spirodelae TaxID=3133431 RepID=A0ABU8T3F8_9PSEU